MMSAEAARARGRSARVWRTGSFDVMVGRGTPRWTPQHWVACQLSAIEHMTDPLRGPRADFCSAPGRNRSRATRAGSGLSRCRAAKGGHDHARAAHFGVSTLLPPSELTRAGGHVPRRLRRPSARRLWRDDLVSDGVMHELHDRLQSELVHDLRAMRLDGLHADAQDGRGAPIRLALRQELGDLALTFRERGTLCPRTAPRP